MYDYNAFFDGAVVHAVLDHLLVSDAKAALSEMLRITKAGGLISIYELIGEYEIVYKADNGVRERVVIIRK